jgi:DNA repair protein RecO (recombination protein O)
VPVYKAEAIVLRQQTLGEADRIISLFTREHGRLRAAARGVRRPTSKLAGRLEPFTHTRLLLARGRAFEVIAQTETVRVFAGIRADLLRGAYAAYLVELVERGVPERDAQEEVFSLILDTLDTLERAGADDAETVSLRFAVRLAAALGYQPETGACVACGRPVPRAAARAHGWGFSAAGGGALCPGCRARDAEAVSVSAGVLAACGYLARAPEAQSDRLRMPPVQRGELAALVQRHLEHRFDARLRAPLVIRRLREAAEGGDVGGRAGSAESVEGTEGTEEPPEGQSVSGAGRQVIR